MKDEKTKGVAILSVTMDDRDVWQMFYDRVETVFREADYRNFAGEDGDGLLDRDTTIDGLGEMFAGLFIGFDRNRWKIATTPEPSA